MSQQLGELPSDSNSLKKLLLKIPILGQFVSLISMYLNQKRWPAYVYHWPERKLAFVRVSKNASTSILAAIMKARFPELDSSSLSVDQINLIAEADMKPYIQEGYDSFAVVRNPYERLASCYLDQVQDRDGLAYFNKLYFGLLSKNLTFLEFVKRADSIPDALKEIHFRKQARCIPEKDQIRIFKLEELNSELLPYLRMHNVSIDKIILNTRSENLSAEDSAMAKPLIRKSYKEDFIRFGYQ